MKLAAFNATCPFEIGDKIKSRRRVKPGEAETFRLDPAAVVEEVHTITDIVCVHTRTPRRESTALRRATREPEKMSLFT